MRGFPLDAAVHRSSARDLGVHDVRSAALTADEAIPHQGARVIAGGIRP